MVPCRAYLIFHAFSCLENWIVSEKQNYFVLQISHKIGCGLWQCCTSQKFPYLDLDFPSFLHILDCLCISFELMVTSNLLSSQDLRLIQMLIGRTFPQTLTQEFKCCLSLRIQRSYHGSHLSRQWVDSSGNIFLFYVIDLSLCDICLTSKQLIDLIFQSWA